ncbi:MAG TPA: hypothetical protein VGL61_35690 [Kofleriaceae bacterium]|jgi:ribosomal protein S27AE
MNVTIDITGFELDLGSRNAIEQRIRQQLEQHDVEQLELVVAWRDTYPEGSDRLVARFVATTRASLGGHGTFQVVVEASMLVRAVDDTVAEVEARARRRRQLEETVRACPWCGGGTFALAPHSFGGLGADALVCMSCGHVEQFVRDPRAITGALRVHVRANPPYR